jgi:hypothetical protein
MGWGGFLLADRKGGAREKRTMGKATQPNTVFAVPPGR